MAGNESAPVASNPVTLDTTKPNGSISIDSGAQFTNLPAVTLTLAAADTNGVAWYFVSESSTPPLPGDPAWVAIPNAPVAALTNLAVPFTFSGGDGIKTVYAWFKDLVGNISTAASSSILLDTTPPTGTITISNGAASTRSIFVTLNLTCSDTGSGCDKMQFSNDNQNWSPAESFAATKQWELSVANGIKTVWAKFQDKGGAWSTVEIKDTIVLSAAFSDDMESGRNKWLVDSNWAQITTGCHSGTTCWTSSPSGSYTPNMNANLKSVSFSTVGLSSLRLSFWHKYALASYNDYAYVEVSKDNGATWQQVAIYGNYYGQSQPSWTQTSLDISTYAGFQTVLVRFRLQTDGNGYVAAGWSIDDVIVQESPNTTALPFKDDVEGGGRNWFVSDHWSITTSDRHSGNYSWTSSPDGNYLPSINAGLTSVAFSTIGYTALNLSFWHKYVLASYNDYAYVEISKDNGSTWDQVAVYGNYYGQSQTSWTQTSLDLISYIGLKSVSIRFRLQTDSNGYVAAGWNIDDVSITGVGVPDQYQLNAAVTPVGAGTINSSPAGISCGADCTETYPSGTVVTLDATSTAAAATFAGWTGSCAGLGSCIVTMDQVKNVTALFDVNGVCGGSNGKVLATVPTSALCDSGSPSDISGTGPWNWSCIGVNKGSTAYCATATVGGHGTANLTAVATQGAIFGQGVTLSGTLKDGSTSAPLAGKSISIVPVSPAGSRLATQSATTLSDGSWSILMTPAVVDTAGDWNTQVGFAGDPSYNPAKVDAPFTISKADTTLTIVASAGSVSPTGTITVTGMISSAQAVNRSGLPIIATFTEPDGTTGHQVTVFTSDQYGHYSAPYSAFGSKSGQWTISARFAGNNDLNAGISASLNLTVAQSAGYAILIQGDYGGTYRGNYTRSMDDIYRRLKNHSFTDENIRYLSYDAGHANVDQLTTRQNVADAITTWAYDRIKAFGVAPLYIIMMDHGSPGGIFHIDPETITPADLDGWLDTLESRVMTDVGQALTSVIVNGSCYSGSFIPGLSKSGRVIVTSSDAGDQSIQGPSVNGNYFGEYFIYYLFQSMDGGNTLGTAFQSARESTFWQKYPIGFNGLEESPIVSWQRPQIDYGGNPALQALRLGIGSNSATLGWQVIPATTTVMSGSSVTLTAETKDLANTASAWVEVRKPSYTPPAPSSDGGQVNLALPKVLGTHDLTGWHFNLTAATELTETGTYTLYLYAMDAGGDVTDPVPVTLYVDSAANNAPNPFTLITPASGASISDQFLIFTWNETGDPDADPVSFTLKISDDSNGTKGGEAQRYESIPQGNYYLDVTTAVRANGNPLFVSGTNYWWEVTAVDNKGRTTTSGASRFKSTFSNALSGIITGYVANAAGAAISGASISVAGGATYKSLSNGKYLMLLSPEMMQLSASAAGYTSSAPVSVAVTSGNVITQNFILSSVNALNGACGGAAGGTFPTAPDSNLCNPGNPTPATGNAVTHTWNWNCAGSNGGSTASCSAYQDTTPPALSLSTLADGARTNNATLNISGTVTDAGGVKSLTIDGTGVPLGANGSFSQLLTLTAGANLITSVATDTANNSSTDTRTITLDQAAPVLTISAPADNSAVHTTGITLSGQVDESSTAVCSINGAPAQGINMSGNSFSLPVTLATNQVNTISVTVTDLAGNQTTVKRTVTSDETAPSLAVTDPAQDITVRQGSYLIKGSVSDNFSSFSQVSVNSDGQLYTPAVTNGAFAQPLSFTTAKTYAVTVSATDAAGNTATVQRNILYSPQATIDLGSASGIRGKTVTIPITLNNPAGTPLSTVRVDIGYDPALLTKPGAVLGAASAAAGKSLDASDQGGGVFRVGLYDTGNTVLASGILANVTFTVAESAANGSLTPLTNTPLASDPQGNDLSVSGAGGTVSVVAMPGDCNADGSVTPGEFTSAINRFMGRAAGASCLSFYGNVSVTPGYFTKVINCFMGRY